MSSQSSLSSTDSFFDEPSDVVHFVPVDSSTPKKSVKKFPEMRALSPIKPGANTRIEKCQQRFVRASGGTKIYVDDVRKFFSNLNLPKQNLKNSDLLSDSSLETDDSSCCETDTSSAGEKSLASSDGYAGQDEDSKVFKNNQMEESTLYFSISSDEEEAYDADGEEDE